MNSISFRTVGISGTSMVIFEVFSKNLRMFGESNLGIAAIKILRLVEKKGGPAAFCTR
jgi:hypothetical protein